MENGSRLKELDTFRGFAAISVVLYHFTIFYDNAFGHVNNYPFKLYYGYFGVQLFFIISGFVIYMTLIKSANLKEFAFKRAARLYPAYITSVIITFFVTRSYSLDVLKVNYADFIFNLTMIQGVIPGVGIDLVDGSYWSLGIEITFYIICALFLLFGLINRPFLVSVISLIFIFVIKLLYINNLIHPLIGD
ncbi:acyltransferase, partial [Neobacillus drentensis]|uniref:acyltransferase family protein n=1 Tax=Neobacillus drentensis TaxID=220684 RepID=UPI0030025AF5